MKANAEAWIKRADEILAKPAAAAHYEAVGEALQFATSMISALYGPESPQARAFRANTEVAGKDTKSGSPGGHLNMLAHGVIENTKAELQAGLIGSVRVYVAGELLAELVRLGKEILSDKTEPAKNVTAVLIAAAFEGVLRKMGEEFAKISDRRKLEEVISALKAADVLKGGQAHTAASYLKFRNDSLHADWNN